MEELMIDVWTEKADAFSGTGHDVIEELRRHDQNATVVAVVLPGSDEAFAGQMRTALTELVQMVPDVLNRRDELDVNAYLNFMLPKKVPAGTRMLELKMLADGMRAVLESGQFVTSLAIAELAGFSKKNPSAQPSKWKREKMIFSIAFQREDYFPLYALQETQGFRPHPAVKDILKIFGDKKDGWAAALWFLADNSYLGGVRPQDMLKTHPEAVIASAMQEVSEDLHG